ncbi:hypothetical protein FGE12_02745 [Aggregicoccus sp. 17bor-14]|uniref:ArnT family glycosyltransferase n=1 Tax=Myxococcaceae TaxID=31 RepID=UPI00129CD49A|nr:MULTISPECIES: hypothetical protein [Myxococcaceae]MBF5041289.1 hypothetical protein [Simulacricoccus sp. 17bor-14]MRI87075.1 hypothetical protein [Aggregicoccus sp. 17bor-14]
MRPSPPDSRLAGVFALGTFLALAACTWVRHSDFGDAQLYRVLVRHLLEDGTWLQLRYLPGVYPRFYEHLPFGLWPYALAARAFGEAALPPLALLMWTGTLLLVRRGAAQLAGPWGGVAAMLSLALCDNVFLRAGQPFLDAPLVLLATAAALPPLLGVPRARGWGLAGLCAAGAVAVKGPFGLVPFAAAVLARALVERRWRPLLVGAAVGVLASLPTLLFLLLSPEWREGYGRQQLLASAAGLRTDGRGGPLMPFRTAVSRFWPGLPLALAGGVVALGRPRALAQRLEAGRTEARGGARVLLLAVVLALAALCLPRRKLWYHALVAFPLLAMLAGAGVGPWLERALAAPQRARRAVLGLGLLFVLAAGASLAGLRSVLMSAPCVVSRELSGAFDRVPAGTALLVVSEKPDWDMLSTLAAERRLVPWPVGSISEPLPTGVEEPRLALVRAELPVAAEWTLIAEARGWRLVQR